MQYEVIVGNVGRVHDSTSGTNAHRDFWEYTKASESGVGRCGGETVTLMGDGNIIKEHTPKGARR